MLPFGKRNAASRSCLCGISIALLTASTVFYLWSGMEEMPLGLLQEVEDVDRPQTPIIATQDISKSETIPITQDTAMLFSAPSPTAPAVENSNKEDSPLKYHLRQDYLEYLRQHPAKTIPKIAHVLFPDATTLPSRIEEFEMLQYNIVGSIHGSSKKKAENPDWELRLYDDDTIKQIIKEAADEGLIPPEEYALLQRAHMIELTDTVRIILLYKHGGFYRDMDGIVNVNLDEVLSGPDKGVPAKMFIPAIYDVNFMQDLFASVPNNRLYGEMIKSMTEKRLYGGPNGGPLPRTESGWLEPSGVMELGPVMYNEVISRVVFEPKEDGTVVSMINDMDEARRAIDSTAGGLIRSARDEWCDGAVTVGFEGCKAVNRGPLFEAYGLIKSWSDNVKDEWKKE